MKTKKEDIIKSVTELALPICNKLGIELYDVDFYKEGADYNLCILIDKKGGVSIDDCENLSKEIDPLLDDADPIECQYCLEVSSCGTDRKLTKPEHFKNAIGERIRVSFYKPIDNSKFCVGELLSYNGDTLTLNDCGTCKVFNIKDISNTKIDVDYAKLFAEKDNISEENK